MTRAIQEVPMNINPEMRRFLTSLRNSVSDMQGSAAPPEAVENFRVTPIAGGNLIEFTRTNVRSYTLYWNKTPDFNSASPIPLDLNSRHEHLLNQGSITVYYWIKARQQSGQEIIVGPESGTTLALGTSSTLPDPPSPGIIIYPGGDGGREVGVGRSGIPFLI